MPRLDEKLKCLKKQGRKALFVYITAGAPDLAATKQAVLEAERAGADVIELGIPFSDPIADGPVIQEAAHRAIQNGMTVQKALALVRELREVTQIPLIAMGYINTMLYFGVETFVTEFQEAGLDGLIVPDLPHEESEEIAAFCRAREFHLAEFITPNTVPERIRETCRNATGFVYCVSVNGVTGVREIDYAPIHKVMKLARKEKKIPLAVGFGIGSAEAAVRAAEEADAVIVGSAVVKKLLAHDLPGAVSLIASIRRALDERVEEKCV